MAKPFTPLVTLLDRLFDKRQDDRRGAGGLAIRVLRLHQLAWREFRLDFCWERAAALAFVTILSLLPLAVLFLSFLRIFRDDFDTTVRSFLEGQVLEYLTTAELTEAVREEIGVWIRGNIAASDLFNLSAGANVLAIAGLVVAALALLVSSERVFCRIWKVRSTRNYLQKLVAFWIILTTSPFLVALSLYVNSLSENPESVVFRLMRSHAALGPLYGFLLPLSVSLFAFSLLYYFLPNTRVKVGPALLGGCVASVLWECLKQGFFGYYFARVKTVTSLYGQLGVFPVFLVFVFVSWLIILWAGELSYAFQNYGHLIRAYRSREKRRERGDFPAALLGIALLERTVSAFLEGRPTPTLDGFGAELGLSGDELRDVVAVLVERGILVESGTEPGKYLLVVHPEKEPLDRIVEALLHAGSREDELAPDPGAPAAIARSHFEARRAYLETFRGRVLADLARPAGQG